MVARNRISGGASQHCTPPVTQPDAAEKQQKCSSTWLKRLDSLFSNLRTVSHGNVISMRSPNGHGGEKTVYNADLVSEKQTETET
jgi:hypothetical protein